MVDYSVSDAPGELFPKPGGLFKMEALALTDLLECPLCLEQLDASAKVLPCQHTFCVSCLQRQEEASRSQLLCPECGTPVQVRTVQELPENLMLVRLLEGLQGLGSDSQRVIYDVPPDVEDQLQESQNREKQGHSEAGSWKAFSLLPEMSALLCDVTSVQQEGLNLGSGWTAVQMNVDPESRPPQKVAAPRVSNQRPDMSGEPIFTPANAVTSNYQTDYWHHEDPGDVGRASVSAPQMQQSFQQAQPLPLCRATCDFNPEEMNLEGSQYCLNFLKGDILTAIRRVDEQWIEAKLGENVGLCPKQFIEPNSAAAKLLKGRRRSRSESAEFCHQTGSGAKDKTTDASNWTAHYGVPQVLAKTPIINALPHSSQRKQPTGERNNSFQTPSDSYKPQGHPQRLSTPSGLPRTYTYPLGVSSRRISRHSDSHRHQSQGEKKMTSGTPPTVSMALVNPQMPSASADGKNSSTQQLSISVCAVQYSYKPRRLEELELKAGEMVGVYGKFKEGWLRGLSLRTGKVGILPSNYVTPVLRTSARIIETKAANASSRYNTVSGKKPTAAKNPAVVLALDRVTGDGAMYSPGQVSSVPNGAQHAMSSVGAAKPSFYGSAQGWDTVRRAFNPHRASNRPSQMSTFNMPSNSQPFAQVQASGYSPALQRKKSIIRSRSNKPHGWMTEPAAPSAAASMKEKDFLSATFHRPRQPVNTPQSILVKPDAHKYKTDKPQKSVRFQVDEDSPPPRRRTSSWSSGTQLHLNCRPGLSPLEVWAPSLTMGRDGPGIFLKEGKGQVLRKGLETAISDISYKPLHSQPSLSAPSAQFSPIRHRVTATHLAQTDSELSLLPGEVVLVHRPRPDGRVLVTQESSGQTGVFHSNILQILERLT